MDKWLLIYIALMVSVLSVQIHPISKAFDEAYCTETEQ